MGKRQRQRIILWLFTGLLAWPAFAGVFDELERLAKPARLTGQRQFLAPDEAFRLSEQVAPDGTLGVSFAVAPGYYLYRDKFAISAETPGVVLGTPRLPASEAKDDPEFGVVEVYKQDFRIDVPVQALPGQTTVIDTTITYQGCAEDGICYPPIKKQVAFAALQPSSTSSAASSSSEQIAVDLGRRSLAATVMTFLGLGVLMGFTPCVFPMVPILSGIIVGQRQPVSAWRGLTLSATYVFAMALTYTAAGIIAGLLGHNLQAAFQHPAIIVTFAATFVGLALSMFGFYEIQLPAGMQARLDRVSRAQRSGSFTGVAIMGVLSAIIVGPCVAPPLAGALAYIGQTGSALIGGCALFALGLGMGLPLLAIGASAGVLLPRAGPWMVQVKQVFGVALLGVAIWFLERVLPPAVSLMLWAALLIACAMFLGALTRTAEQARALARLRQALGFMLLIYGATLIVGAAGGATDALRPLEPWATAALGGGDEISFRAVKSPQELTRELGRSQRPLAMLDVYADWCVECKHLERETFTAPDVRRRLESMTLLRADVTANDDTDRALLSDHGLYGPPAVLFFRDGVELREQRVVGFMDAGAFGRLLDAIGAP